MRVSLSLASDVPIATTAAEGRGRGGGSNRVVCSKREGRV